MILVNKLFSGHCCFDSPNGKAKFVLKFSALLLTNYMSINYIFNMQICRYNNTTIQCKGSV